MPQQCCKYHTILAEPGYLYTLSYVVPIPHLSFTPTPPWCTVHVDHILQMRSVTKVLQTMTDNTHPLLPPSTNSTTDCQQPCIKTQRMCAICATCMAWHLHVANCATVVFHKAPQGQPALCATTSFFPLPIPHPTTSSSVPCNHLRWHWHTCNRLTTTNLHTDKAQSIAQSPPSDPRSNASPPPPPQCLQSHCNPQAAGLHTGTTHTTLGNLRTQCLRKSMSKKASSVADLPVTAVGKSSGMSD